MRINQIIKPPKGLTIPPNEAKMCKRKRIYHKFGGHCAYCGKQLAYKEMTVDHVIPKAKGGRTKIDNLFPCCKECNKLKGMDDLQNFRSKFAEIYGNWRFYYEQYNS